MTKRPCAPTCARYVNALNANYPDALPLYASKAYSTPTWSRLLPKRVWVWTWSRRVRLRSPWPPNFRWSVSTFTAIISCPQNWPTRWKSAWDASCGQF